MIKWPKNDKLEGRKEIYLDWIILARIAPMMLWPLIIAPFLESFALKVVCWVFTLLLYIGYLRVWGPCVMAVAVGAIPWYVFFEWRALPRWLVVIVTIISLIEISYIRHRMRFIEQIRKEENLQFQG